MAIKTMSYNTGDGTWSEGWHQLTIEKAEYGDWNDKNFLDVWFKGYPDNFNLRIYEAINKETHEEFALAKFFKLANAGILDKVKSPSGKEAIQYDDEASGLVGKEINALFYKDGKYTRISDRIAPVAQEGKVLSYTSDDVIFWQNLAQKHQESRDKSTPTVTDTIANNVSESDIPF